jgi:hypothetical protein
MITSPTSGADYGTGQTVNFTATATDPADGSLAGNQVQWTDDLDGSLGSGTSISVVLSGGPCGISTHHVTVTATDSHGHSGVDTITVTEGGIC